MINESNLEHNDKIILNRQIMRLVVYVLTEKQRVLYTKTAKIVGIIIKLEKL